MGKLKRMPESDTTPIGDYYSCMDCEWEGKVAECDFDYDYDEFYGIDRKYVICPECGGGLDC